MAVVDGVVGVLPVLDQLISLQRHLEVTLGVNSLVKEHLRLVHSCLDHFL